MIEFKNQVNDEPYLMLKKQYDNALNSGQNYIEAMVISSFSHETQEVDSRYVNIKSINGEEFTFFTNYKSPKSLQFSEHNQISAVFFWSEINVQIRIKAYIKKISKYDSDEHYKSRSSDKNALALSSDQSQKIIDYKEVHKRYEKAYKNKNLHVRPDYWGGFSFIPYYFEFWTGHKSRINKREVFIKKNNKIWDKCILQP